jgi:hypothetical protein
VGLSIQNVGVHAPQLPRSIEPGEELEGLPEPFAAGWTWRSLDRERWLEPAALAALAARVAVDAGAAALAYSVDDSDSAYLVGADQAGVTFRVTVNRGVEGAPELAAWAAEHAPASPDAAELEDVLARRYVFAEAGLRVLLLRLGLVTVEAAAAEAGDTFPTAVTGGFPFVDVAAATAHPLHGARRHTWLDGGDEIEWRLLAAAEPDGVDLYLCAAEETPRRAADRFADEEQARRAVELPGVAAGEWRKVPAHVERTLAATLAWVAAQPR